jgi:thiol-disulfide isomerase/thioredoxin
LLAREVIKEFGDKARFKIEDFGASPLAERFGIDKYPAIFVDDALVARPEDFYGWKGVDSGRYLPWDQVANRRKFQADLRRMIRIRLAGGEIPALPAPQSGANEKRLPPLRLTTLDGKPLTFQGLKGKPVVVEFWATWCPPCIATLQWMKDLPELKTGAATLVGVAVESKPDEVAAMVKKMALPGRIVLGTPEILAAFGGLPAIPTLYVADRTGKVVRAFYGAPPGLHEEIRKELQKLQAGEH